MTRLATPMTTTGSFPDPLLKNTMTNGKHLLDRMVYVRAVEETIAARYSDQQMRCPTHLSIGQEGVAVGVCEALRQDDWAVSTHRAHAHYLAKGGRLDPMIAEIHGKATGCSQGKGGSMHLVDMENGFLGSTAIVGNSIPLGVGAALSEQVKGTDRVAVVFLGDAATEEGAFHESANFAVVRNLPVLFVCENNRYSVYSPLSVRQPEGHDLHKFAEAYGLIARKGFGNHVGEVYETTLAAVEEMRAGKGPMFLEFDTYRWREHCGPNFDNDLGYRTVEEYEEWKALDPIQATIRDFAVSEDEVKAMQAGHQARIDEAFEKAIADPFPDAAEMFTQVYAEDL